MSTIDKVLSDTQSTMLKSIEYLKKELKGIRTGRASPALVEFVKVDYYGAHQDLKSLAAISVPEPSQLLIKPFDPSAIGDIKKGIESAGLGLNPISDGKALRVNIPALSGDRRKQLGAHAKKLGEECKIALRNARRDANKHADALKTGKEHVPEDEIKQLHTEIQDLLKKYETEADQAVAAKQKEIETV